MSISGGTLPIPAGRLSIRNSTGEPLPSSQSFVGVADDVRGFATAAVLMFADVDSAVDGISLEQSTDGINWDSSQKYTLKAGIPLELTATLVGRFFRLSLTNGPDEASVFRAETIYHVAKGRSLTTKLDQVLTQSDGAQLVRVATDPVFDRNTGLSGLHTTHNVFGCNPEVGTAVYEDLWEEGGLYNFLQAALPLRIRAGGDVADTAGGSGARKVTFIGLDSDWLEISETIVTNGALASVPTSQSFIRINHAFVSECGTYGGSNEGVMTVETTGGVEVALMAAGDGKALQGIASVPEGKRAYLTGVRVAVGGTNKTASFQINIREKADIVVAPFGPAIIPARLDELGGGLDATIDFESWDGIGPRSDIWFSGIAQISSSPMTCSFEYVLVDV